MSFRKLPDTHCLPGKISSISKLMNDTPWGWAVNISIDYEDHGGQNFVFDLNDKEMAEKVMAEIRQAFGVKRTRDLKGKKCFALFSFPAGLGSDEYIEGLESEATGRRFTKVGFLRRNFPHLQKLDRLEQKTSDLLSSLRSHKRAAENIQKRLETISRTFVDWEKT